MNVESAVISVVNKTMGMSPKYNFSVQPFACTDGEVIFLPKPDAQQDLDAYVRKNIASGLHECLHLLHTDFEFKERTADSGSLWFSLINALEDARINAIGKQTVVSFPYWRARLMELSQKNLIWRADPQLSKWKDSFLVSVYWHSCDLLDVLFMNNKQYEHEERFVCKHEEGLPYKLIKETKKILSEKLPAARNTGDIVCIADELLNLLEQYSKKDQDLGKSIQADLQEAKEQRRETFLRVKQRSSDSQSAASDQEGSCEQGGEFDSLRKQGIRISPFKSKRLLRDKFALDYMKEWKQALGNKAALVKLIRNSFRVKSVSKDMAELACEGDNLTGMLEWASTRSLRIYSRQKLERRPNAEICILLDRSGSMGLKQMTTAKLATLALCECLEKVQGCSSEVFAFPGIINGDDLTVCKIRSESTEKMECRLQSLTAFGSTPYQQATLGAYTRIKSCNKKLKLVVLITDGRIAEDFAASTLSKYEAAGIELAVLSIGIDNSKAFSTNYQFVEAGYGIVFGLCRLLKGTHFRKALFES